MSRAGTIEHLARAVHGCGTLVPESPRAVDLLRELGVALASPPDPDEPEVDAILAERDRQRAKGFADDQDFPDTHTMQMERDRQEHVARTACDNAMKIRRVTWEHILREEVAEALSAMSDDARREELLQVAAVCVRWARSIRVNRRDR